LDVLERRTFIKAAALSQVSKIAGMKIGRKPVFRVEYSIGFLAVGHRIPISK